MLTENEFRTKRHLVLDKPNYTFIMNRVPNAWVVYEIEKGIGSPLMVQSIGLTEDEAYEYYLERMASFGFRKFNIIEE